MKRSKTGSQINYPTHEGKEPMQKNPLNDEIEAIKEKFVTLEYLVDVQACNFCKKELRNCPTLLCAECKILFCHDCLLNNVEGETHKWSHDYYVLNRLKFPLYSSDWSAKEELFLMRGNVKINIKMA